MNGPVVECVPNFSEGTDARRVEAIVAAMRVEGVRLLDWSMDADHNRSVVTIAGEPAAVVEAAVRGAGKAVELIDLTRQQGVHPRIGAADVIPLCPSPASNWSNALCWRGRPVWKSGGASVCRSSFMKPPPQGPIAPTWKKFAAGSLKDLGTPCARNSRRPDLGGPGLQFRWPLPSAFMPCHGFGAGYGGFIRPENGIDRLRLTGIARAGWTWHGH